MIKKKKQKNELPEYSVVIIGAGYTGLSLAKLLMKYDGNVLLIDEHYAGAKSSLEVKLFSYIANKWRGISTYDFINNLPTEMNKARSEASLEFNEEIFKDSSITFMVGVPRILSERVIEINDAKFRFKKLVISTGSIYKPLHLQGLTENMYIDPNQISTLDHSIDTVAIYGTNWIALELGQALTKIGIKV
ncbi:MAG: FAD-dependent oxidoreductase, partial [Metamycoplasmataceae bacterium]